MPPVPDPTVMTTEQLDRTVDALRDYVNAQIKYVDERLRGIDVATRLLNEQIHRAPTEMQREIVHVRELVERHIRGADAQTAERDKRLDAAFAGMKEATKLQDECNQTAIDKAEAATQKAIDKAETATGAGLTRLEALFTATTSPINKNLDDLKSRMDRLEAAKLGGQERVVEGRQNFSYVTGIVVFAFFVFTALGTIIAIIAAKP